MINKLKNQIINLTRCRFLNTRIVLGIDVVASICASAFAILLMHILIPSYDFSRVQILTWLTGSLVASVVVFKLARIYRAIIRYSTFRELGRIFSACFGKDVILLLVIAAFQLMKLDNSMLIGMAFIDFLMTLCAISLIRIIMIAVYDRVRSAANAEDELRHILVYGTNDKAVSAVSRLRNSSHYHVDGFIAFGNMAKGHQLSGMEVNFFSNEESLKAIVKRTGVKGVLFPYVADARDEQDRLIVYCRDCQLKTYVIPEIDEMTDGSVVGKYIRKIRIEDLLGRDEIKISMKEIIENFSGKVVMVTGAAGSIGSELCRQLATFEVKKLILFDNAETPLHNIRLELEDTFPNLDFVPVIGDIRSIPRLDFVFKKYAPQIVFHAAAYKHVPLMETNPCEAVWVNVGGSRQVADKCVEYNVEKMVMVSTDKAVNPTNIMGCSKRLAEIYVQSLGLAIERGEKKGNTKFVTTRFGNVLGSNGSVIPRFREQIEHGGPITVTHPNITRFFMTIPEACRLVMEAATFATGTQIFVFDMGKSVKIASLAEKMIRLAGLEVGKDIQIEFTGLRPGEKLYEEVLATKENTLPTCHERIFIARAREYSYVNANKVVAQLIELATRVSIPEMVKLMKQTVPEFKSKNSEFEKFDQIDID